MLTKMFKFSVLSATLLTAVSGYAIPGKFMMLEGEDEAGSFGAGNGGDGVVLKHYSANESNIFYPLKYESLKQQQIQFSKDGVKQLYSLDLVDMGLEANSKVEYTTNSKSNSETVCIADTGCYAISNSALFNELIDYDGFFGIQTESKTDEVSIAYATTSELAALYEKHNSVWRQAFEIRDSENNEHELIALGKQLEEIKEKYLAEFHKTHNNVKSELYSKNTTIAIGLINKVEQIRKIDPSFAQRFTDTLLSLEWEVLNLPLNEINDEGEIASKLEAKVQMAHRSYGVVKISNLGWNKPIEVNGSKILPMNTSNKIALIAHEVMYEITKSQGDKNSERARLATGFLFKSNTSKRYIKKAIRLINR